jgi:hypothetical protein
MGRLAEVKMEMEDAKKRTGGGFSKLGFFMPVTF